MVETSCRNTAGAELYASRLCIVEAFVRMEYILEGILKGKRSKIRKLYGFIEANLVNDSLSMD
jgi:hypothetical protein